MMLDCHAEITRIRKDTKFTIALAGNPNVGKSTIFNEMTGLGAVTANYPGKTVALNIGSAVYQGVPFGIIDLPGTYSLGSVSDDQLIARREIIEGHAEVVVAIVDATNLERNLYLVLQLIDLGYPLIVACNMMDLAAQQNICFDTIKLSRLLGVPVVPITATKGEGIEELIKTCSDYVDGQIILAAKSPKYGQDILSYVDKLSETISHNLKNIPFGLSPRALAILLLEEDGEFVGYLRGDEHGARVVEKAAEIYTEIEKTHGEKAGVRMARERHGYEGFLVDQVQTIGECRPTLATKLWRLSLNPLTGLPILIAGLILLFMIMFYVGNFLSDNFNAFWTLIASPQLKNFIAFAFGHGALARTLLWGLDAGIMAALSVGIPYILTFYVILALLEDTGYLNSIAFLSDSLMHKIGLHGRAVIPIVAGAGCNVPAIIGTRVLTTKREKVIACTLITIFPCSARTAVIMGAVAFFLGWQWALMLYFVDFAIGIAVGRILAVALPGKSSGLVMEMFPFRVPKLTAILKKTWYRFKEFILIAAPIIVIGSFLLGGLYETKFMWVITKPMSLIIENWLGLPAVAGICLLFGILRKEMALQLLLALAIIQYGPNVHNLLSFMTKQQIFIFALVTTLYIPCVAAISALINELGWKTTLALSLFTIALAVAVGGVANHLLNFVHII